MGGTIKNEVKFKSVISLAVYIFLSIHIIILWNHYKNIIIKAKKNKLLTYQKFLKEKQIFPFYDKSTRSCYARHSECTDLSYWWVIFFQEVRVGVNCLCLHFYIQYYFSDWLAVLMGIFEQINLLGVTSPIFGDASVTNTFNISLTNAYLSLGDAMVLSLLTSVCN